MVTVIKKLTALTVQCEKKLLTVKKSLKPQPFTIYYNINYITVLTALMAKTILLTVYKNQNA